MAVQAAERSAGLVTRKICRELDFLRNLKVLQFESFPDFLNSTDNFLGMNYSSVDYISPGSPNYTYYERKHDPCSLYNSIANNT
jgi:hypothetical protein